MFFSQKFSIFNLIFNQKKIETFNWDFLLSVVLMTDGHVYAFGSNNYGQLGVGDQIVRGCPTPVKVPAGISVVMVAAGSHHSALLTSDGQVLTWGAFLVTIIIIKV